MGNAEGRKIKKRVEREKSQLVSWDLGEEQADTKGIQDK